MPVRFPTLQVSSRSMDSMGGEILGARHYNSSDAQRLAGWGQFAQGPNDLALTYRFHRNRVREQAEINPHVKKALQILVSNTIGAIGFNPYISQFPGVNKRWNRWKKECDPREEHGWTGLLYQIAWLLFRDGAVLIFKRERFDDERTPRSKMRLQIQVMEVDHLDENWHGGPGVAIAPGNRIVGSVEHDPTDRPVAYWLFNRHPDDTLGIFSGGTMLQRMRVPADRVIFAKMPGRPGSSRTSPWLRTALIPSRELNGYLDAESLRKKMAANHVFWIQTPGVGDDGTIATKIFDAWGKDAELYGHPQDQGKYLLISPTPGQVKRLPPGYTVKVAEAATSAPTSSRTSRSPRARSRSRPAFRIR